MKKIGFLMILSSLFFTACKNDEVPGTWQIGDTKPMTINGTEYNIQIIGKHHDVYSDRSGTAPLTFQIVEIYDMAPMNSTKTNKTGWAGSDMRNSYLPTVLNVMPSEIQTAIKSVDKLSLKGDKSGLETTSDKLFLLSEMEIRGKTYNSNGFEEGKCYEYYINGGTAKKESNWWARGTASGSNTGFCYVYYGTGGFFVETATTSCGVSFGFCF